MKYEQERRLSNDKGGFRDKKQVESQCEVLQLQPISKGIHTILYSSEARATSGISSSSTDEANSISHLSLKCCSRRVQFSSTIQCSCWSYEYDTDESSDTWCSSSNECCDVGSSLSKLSSTICSDAAPSWCCRRILRTYTFEYC